MSTGRISDSDSQSESSAVEPHKDQLRTRSLRQLLVLVLCFAAILWAWRVGWEARNPVLAAARKLRSSDASQRLAAIQEVSELGTSGTGEAIRPLTSALADQEATVRRAAAQALGNVGSLAAKAGTESDALREAAHGLISALKDPAPSVRIGAAGSLRILAGITPGYSSSATGKSRAAAAAKPAESKPSVVDKSAVVDALVALLDDRDPDVRQASLFALATVAPSELGDPPKALFAALEDDSAPNRAMAIGTLVAFSHGLDPLVQPLLRHLANDEPQVREACIQALRRIRPSALTNGVSTSLIEGLQSHDPDVRVRIVSLMAQISPDVRIAIPALIAVLKKEPIDSDQTTTEGSPPVITVTGPAPEAAKALGRLAPGTPVAGEAIAALTEVVQSGPPQRRASAIDALGHFGREAAVAVPALVAVLGEAETDNEPTRDKESAAEALGRIAPGTSSADQALAALTAALKSGSASARRAAILALPSFGHSSAGSIPQLRTLKESDPTPNVRKAAASALETLEQGPNAQKQESKSEGPAPESPHP